MKKVIKTSTVLLTVISTILFSLILYGNETLPDDVKTISENVTLSGIYNITTKTKTVSPATNISVGSKNTQTAKLKLFGAIPVKDINFTKTQRRYVAVGGELLGIRLKTKGVLIVGTENFESYSGVVCPASNAGIKIGDTLLSINGTEISDNSQLSKFIENSDGNPLSVKIIRDGQTLTVSLIPQKSKLTNLYKCGLWIRDSTGGIGTLTYVDLTTGAIASLGHGIYDVDTNELIPSDSGNFVCANLSGVTKGTVGTAGELKGNMGTDIYGDILVNCENGIYGSLLYYDKSNNVLPVALSDEIKVGKAQIISTVNNNQKAYYDIEIEKISDNSENKNMIIKITDKNLLEITGGIVQGMSGSPIIQNGMFVGAVTHVFINDPTKGYGILAENMIETADKTLEEYNLLNAS